MNFAEKLLWLSRKPLVGGIGYTLLKLLGVELPRCVPVGGSLSLPHGAYGLVVHENTRIGTGVKLFQGVTLGRADQEAEGASGGGIVVGDNVIICAGAKVLFRSGHSLTIGNGAVIGANAVVLKDVAAGEVWAGVPARCVRQGPLSSV